VAGVVSDPEAGVRIRVGMASAVRVGVLGPGVPGMGVREEEGGLRSRPLPLVEAEVTREPEGASEAALRGLLAGR
jgi:hypothetical protein